MPSYPASTARRGFTGWEIKSAGVAGHSGQIFTDTFGYGAVYEITRVIDEMRRTLREPNMTFNVGMLLGGAEPEANRAGDGSVKGKDNIIPSAALAKGEVRSLSPEQVARVKDKMHAIAAKSLPGTKTEVTFREGYPPMAPTAGNKRLLKLLNEGSISVGLGEYVFPALRVTFHPLEIAHLLGVVFPIFSSYLGHKHFSFAKETEPGAQ